jgi:predicted acyltransferase (DUF342 family)
MIATLASLVALTGSLVALPMMPAFMELFLRRDIGPLPVKNRTENVADFAHDFRTLFEDRSEATPHTPAGATAVVLNQHTVLAPGLFFADHIYAKKRLIAGGSNVFSAILGDSDVDLGGDSTVLCWVHAEGMVVAGAGTQLYGRASARSQVQLGYRCHFERVRAPEVTVVGGAGVAALDPALTAAASMLDRATERLLVPKDFVLGTGQTLCRNVVAGGSIYLADSSCVIGSLKSNGAMELEPRVRIAGSLISASHLHIGDECFVRGPVFAEGELVIESGTQIGTPEHPTTVRARRIRIAPRVTVCGSLWAHERGEVTN